MTNYDKAIKLLQSGQYEQAIIQFTEYIEMTPSQSAYANRAFCYAQVGNNSKAIDDFNSAHQVCLDRINEPNIAAEQRELNLIDMTRYQIQIGYLLTEMNRFEEAAVYYQTAILNYVIIKDQSKIEALTSLSKLYCDSSFANISYGNQRQAVLDLTNAIKTAKTVEEKQEALFAADITGLRQFIEYI